MQVFPIKEEIGNIKKGGKNSVVLSADVQLLLKNKIYLLPKASILLYGIVMWYDDTLMAKESMNGSEWEPVARCLPIEAHVAQDVFKNLTDSADSQRRIEEEVLGMLGLNYVLLYTTNRFKNILQREDPIGFNDSAFRLGVITTYRALRTQAQVNGGRLIQVSPAIVDATAQDYMTNTNRKLSYYEAFNNDRQRLDTEEPILGALLHDTTQALELNEDDSADFNGGATITYRLIKNAYDADRLNKLFS